MKKATGINYIILAMLAFAGLGLEVVLAFWIEPMIYGSPINDWTDLQTIIHWVVTCSLWGVASYGIIHCRNYMGNRTLFHQRYFNGDCNSYFKSGIWKRISYSQ